MAEHAAGCLDPRCGQPRPGPGRAPVGWVQVHFAPGQPPNRVIEPDRWYASAGCAAAALTEVAAGNTADPVGVAPPTD